MLRSGLAFFLRAIEWLNASSLLNSTPVQRADHYVQSVFDRVGLSTPLVRLSRRAHAMAAESESSISQPTVAQPSTTHSTGTHSTETHPTGTHSIVTQPGAPVQSFSFTNQRGTYPATRYVADPSTRQSVFQQPAFQQPQLQPPQHQSSQLQSPQLQPPQLQPPQLQPPQLQPPQFPQTPLGGRILRDEAAEPVVPVQPVEQQSIAQTSIVQTGVVERHAISTASRLGLVLAGLLVLISASALGLSATSGTTQMDPTLAQAGAELTHSLAAVNSVPANAGPDNPGMAESGASLAIIAQRPNATPASDTGANAPVTDANSANAPTENAVEPQVDASNGGAILALPQVNQAEANALDADSGNVDGQPVPAGQAAPETEAAQPKLGILSFLTNRSASSAAEADAGQGSAEVAQVEGAAQSPVDQALAILVPTATPTRTPYPTFTAMPTATPTATPTEFIPDEVPLLRVIGPSLLKPTDTPTPPPTATFTPTPTPLPISPGKLWSTFQPGPAAEVDHLWIERPFAPGTANQLVSPNYQFGTTASNRYRIHHGVDISNPLGTPVISGAEGEVIHAGVDNPVLLGPYNNFYGNAVVILLDQRLPVAGGDLNVYLLYGHLNEVTVSQGQRVAVGDVIGKVGMTGIAIGPHLHVEMRLGANTYDNSVNPYLWLKPLDNGGAVAVRLLTADGRAWPGGRVSIVRYGAGGVSLWARHVETYLNDEILGPDPVWGENGAMGSVPPGSYLIIANVNGEQLRTEITVEPGQTTFVEMRTAQ